jgi:hypothetical protein
VLAVGKNILVESDMARNNNAARVEIKAPVSFVLTRVT